MIKLRTLLLYDSLYIILAVIAIIYSYLLVNYFPYRSKYQITDKVIEGYIDNLTIDGNHLKIVLIGKEKIIVNYYFKNIIEKESFKLKLGDVIVVNGEMTIPRGLTVFNLFDYQKYLYRNHIFFIMRADKINKIKDNSKGHYTIKQNLIDYIDKIGKSSSYIKALVIGNDDDFKDDVNKSYQFNGVSHLFAISGSHISFLAVILLWLLKKLKIEENKRYYLIFLFLLFYMFLTGYAGSVIRAVIFFFLLSLNKMYYFNIKTINILLLSLFFILITRPNLLYDIGFQFSFLISLYLIMYQDLIIKNRNHIKQLFIISLIAFLVSIPICINNFFQINILSPFINLLFVPYVTFILFPLAFISLVFPFIDSIFILFINILETISLFLSNIKVGEIILAKPSFIFIVIYYLLITLCIKGIMNKKYRYCMTLLVFIFIHNHINFFNFNPYVVFIDVGQGDAILINLPYNKGTILIDTGGKISFEEEWQRKKKTYSTALDTIIPYLKSLGIKELDYLILTHGDADHMGESINLIKNFKVSKILLNRGSLVKLEQELISVSKSLHIPCVFSKKGDILNLNNYVFHILNPSSDTNENDNSIVIYTKINNTRLLFTGDISFKVENKIIDAYPHLNVDILKLGHHGSITSTSELFLDSLKPTHSIIQVGLNNQFNHPSKIVLERLYKRNIKVLTTSIFGSIKVIIGTNDVMIISSLT